MQLRTHTTDGWTSVSSDGDTDGRDELEKRLTQLVTAEKLVVLAGLGTSRCVSDDAGARVAPSMADLWNRAKDGSDDADWRHALEAAGWRDDFGEDIELLLSRCQMATSLRADGRVSSFVEACEQLIVESCRFVEPGTPLPVHEAFLRKIARRPTRLPRAQLFTTNYDLAFETAASRTGFAVVDGFSHAAPQQFDSGYFDVDLAVRDRDRAASPVDWMPNVLQLMKLHGSVDWREGSGAIIRDSTAAQPLIVYPRASKFEVSYQPPFLDLMGRFQAALRRPETGVLIVGSGLADQHLAAPVLAAIRSNVRLSVLIIRPGLMDSTAQHVQQIEAYIEGGDRRLGLVEATFEDVVPLLPDLVPASEAEQHESRTAS